MTSRIQLLFTRTENTSKLPLNRNVTFILMTVKVSEFKPKKRIGYNVKVMAILRNGTFSVRVNVWIIQI